MKILKRILLALAILLVIICAIGFMFPSKFRVERSAVINKPVAEVFAFANNMKNFNSWSPWFEKDTAALYTYEGPESGVGATQKWESKVDDVGNGSMKIVEVIQDKSIREELRFMEEGVAYAEYQFEALGDSTRMTWSLEADAGMNPLRRIMGKFMDKFVGPDFDRGMSKLNSLMSSMPSSAASAWKAEVTTITPMHYMYLHDTASATTISQHIGAGYGVIGAAMKKQKLQMAGPPMVFYLNDSQTIFEMNIAVPVDKPGKADGKVLPGELKAGNAAVVHYSGAYDKVQGAYAALGMYVKENGKKINGPFWEVYLTDPGMEKDTTKWKTDIFCPVE
jgi:effector-binding domain-containing protein